MTKTDQQLVQQLKAVLDIASDIMTELAKRDIVASFGLNQNKEQSEVTNFRASKVIEAEVPVAPGASPTA